MSRKIGNKQDIASDSLANYSKKSMQKGRSLSTAASAFTARKVSARSGPQSELGNVIPQIQVPLLDSSPPANNSPTLFLKKVNSTHDSDICESERIAKDNVQTMPKKENSFSIKEHLFSSLKKLAFFKSDSSAGSQNPAESSTNSVVEKDLTDVRNDSNVNGNASLLPESTVTAVGLSVTVVPEDNKSKVNSEIKSFHGHAQEAAQPGTALNILNPKLVKTESKSLFILRPQNISQNRTSSDRLSVGTPIIDLEKQSLRIEHEKILLEQQRREKQNKLSQKISVRNSGDLINRRVSPGTTESELKSLKAGSNNRLFTRRNTEESFKLPRSIDGYNTTASSNKLDQQHSSKKLLFPPNSNFSYSGSSLLSNESDQSSQGQQLKPSRFLAAAQDVGKQLRAKSLIERWGEMTQHGQFVNDQDHLVYMRNAKRRSMIDLPDSLISGVRDEVYPILQDTLKQYKLELGNTHILTFEMQRRIQTLKEQINNSSAKEV